MSNTTTPKASRRLKTRMRQFVREARAADAAIEAGAEVYRAHDVHAWLERLARGAKARRPAPRHK